MDVDVTNYDELRGSEDDETYMQGNLVRLQPVDPFA